MQVANTDEKKFYESGFRKEIARPKHNLMINERLKAARNRKKMSAQAVVNTLKEKGVSVGHSTLQGYEADEQSLNHRYPSILMLIELANFYGCSMDYIFGMSDRFKTYELGKETDIRDLLDSRKSITYNGQKLTKAQREKVVSRLDKLLAEVVKVK
jgi:transcriptional regulator with XRE-family HTH domain